jgi:hypothetical protein
MKPAMQAAIVLLGFLVIVSAIVDHRTAKAQTDHKDAQALPTLTGYAKEDAQAWVALLADPDKGRINDPASFQQHCGEPATRVRRPGEFALVYPDQNLLVMFTRRKLGTTKQEIARDGGSFIAFQDRALFVQINPKHIVSAESALTALHCTAQAKN